MTKPEVFTHRPTTVTAMQFTGTMQSFDTIDAWMETIDPDANRGHSERDGKLVFDVRAGTLKLKTGRRNVEVSEGCWVLHRFVAGESHFWVLTAAEFDEMYDPAPVASDATRFGEFT